MPENVHRKHEVRVGLTEQEHQQVWRAAAARSLPMALWLRQLTPAAFGKSNSESNKSPPSLSGDTHGKHEEAQPGFREPKRARVGGGPGQVHQP